VLARDYVVNGAFELTAEATSARAAPIVPGRTFRFHVDLSPQSWNEVTDAIQQQDTLLRCGIGLDPDELLPKLKAILNQGFEATLPEKLFRPIEMPASVQRTVQIEDGHVDLAVETRGLKLTDEAVWYAAAVQTQAQPPGR
jgi:hypothetical protein